MEIGDNQFRSKRAAIDFYRSVLNSNEVGSVLKRDDFLVVMNLLALHPKAKRKIGIGVKCIKISLTTFGTPGFEIIRIDGSTEFFSYRKIITGPTSSMAKFSRACRQAIQEDLNSVKNQYFEEHSKNGRSPCQETGLLHSWEDLCVDHRQPNTLSVIIDRFVEITGIKVDEIKYSYVDGGPDKFADQKLEEIFREYHRKKATLRVVHRMLNSSRSHQARVSRNHKDRKIPF